MITFIIKSYNKTIYHRGEKIGGISGMERYKKVLSKIVGFQFYVLFNSKPKKAILILSLNIRGYRGVLYLSLSLPQGLRGSPRGEVRIEHTK
jgi:hypothetical protein